VSALAKLVDRLERVKQTGPGRWLARCPAHEDRSPSLSIRELGDGRILLHDFGGCEPTAVLDSIGLRMADLFPVPLVTDGRPAPRQDRPAVSTKAAQDRLEDAAHEAAVAAVILSDLEAGVALTSEVADRFARAAGAIVALARPAREGA
jgi:hypothetical protein